MEQGEEEEEEEEWFIQNLNSSINWIAEVYNV